MKQAFDFSKFFLLFVLIFCAGCFPFQVRPFKLDINVNFEETKATVIGTDSSGEVVFNHIYKKEGDKWQKSMDHCSPLKPAEK